MATVIQVEGLRRLTAGSVHVLGHDPLGDAGTLAGRIGCQSQEWRLPDHIRVGEGPRPVRRHHAGAADWRELMEQWGLEGKRDASFASLSGGQRRRVADHGAIAVASGWVALRVYRWE